MNPREGRRVCANARDDGYQGDGVATEEDVGIDTLAGRLRAVIGDDGAAVTWGFITAWALVACR